MYVKLRYCPVHVCYGETGRHVSVKYCASKKGDNVSDFVDRNKFCNEKGETDWIAYHNAQIDNGELCYQCGAFIYNFLHFLDSGVRRMCSECNDLLNNDGESCSSKYIRCPYCKKLIDTDYSENYEIFEDGEHITYCDSCDMKIEFTTYVSYSFESPPMKDNTDK